MIRIHIERYIVSVNRVATLRLRCLQLHLKSFERKYLHVWRFEVRYTSKERENCRHTKALFRQWEMSLVEHWGRQYCHIPRSIVSHWMNGNLPSPILPPTVFLFLSFSLSFSVVLSYYLYVKRNSRNAIVSVYTRYFLNKRVNSLYHGYKLFFDEPIVNSSTHIRHYIRIQRS